MVDLFSKVKATKVKGADEFEFYFSKRATRKLF